MNFLSDYITFIYLLKIGNKANHSTANNINPNTLEFDFNLDASRTDANIAALVESEPGNLHN